VLKAGHPEVEKRSTALEMAGVLDECHRYDEANCRGWLPRKCEREKQKYNRLHTEIERPRPWRATGEVV